MPRTMLIKTLKLKFNKLQHDKVANRHEQKYTFVYLQFFNQTKIISRYDKSTIH